MTVQTSSGAAPSGAEWPVLATPILARRDAVAAEQTSRFAADAARPQRDLLLDAARMRRRLSRTLGAHGAVPFDRCEIVRTKYRVGESVRVVYRLAHEEREWVVACRTGAVVADTGNAPSCDPLRPTVYDREIDTAFWVFPHDRSLRGLELLCDATEPHTQLAIGDACRWWVRSRLVAFAPERAATAQCLDRSGAVRAYAKVHAAGDDLFGAAGHRALARALQQAPSRGALRVCVPRIIAHDPAYRLLLFSPAPGRRLIDMSADELPGALAQLGAALATLHALPAPSTVALPRFTRFDAPRLHQAATVIARARPDTAHAALALADRFSHCPAPSQPAALLHGDVNSKNWFVDGHMVTLIDLDQLAIGAPAAEVGSMLAALRFLHRTGALSATAEAELARGFLAGYASCGSLPSAAALRWYMAAALLMERALRAVNRVRDQALAVLPQLLADARALLDEVVYA
ncbi:MAG TPA: phosphotransferase [Gemmatimonadaceae bacterium]|nr:phosphotransferase [Gemmatimonadaceae bacterium]